MNKKITNFLKPYGCLSWIIQIFITVILFAIAATAIRISLDL